MEEFLIPLETESSPYRHRLYVIERKYDKCQYRKIQKEHYYQDVDSGLASREFYINNNASYGKLEDSSYYDFNIYNAQTGEFTGRLVVADGNKILNSSQQKIPSVRRGRDFFMPRSDSAVVVGKINFALEHAVPQILDGEPAHELERRQIFCGEFAH